MSIIELGALGDMSRIILSAVTEPDSMTDVDRQRWIWWFDGMYHMLVYHEYQEGQLSQEYVERFDGWIAGMMSIDHFRTWWASERIQNRFTDSFQGVRRGRRTITTLD